MSNVTAVPIRPLAKGSIVKLWIALIVLVLAAGAIAWWGTAPLQVTTTQSGLRFRVIHEGTGEPATDRIGEPPAEPTDRRAASRNLPSDHVTKR